MTELFWMGQGKLGRGTQQQHKKATPHSSPCQNETTNYGFDGISAHTWHVVRTYQYSAGILVRMQKSMLFSVFLLDVSTPPRSGDLRNTRFVFRGPIWMRLKSSGSFCVGQVPGTSHVATRPKKHWCERRICLSLSRPFAAGPASSLFVVVQSVLDVIRIPGTTVVASPGFFPPFFCAFFVGWFFKKEYQVLEEIVLFLLLLAVFLLLDFRSFPRFFLCQSVCTRAAWWLYCINEAAYCPK